MQKCVRASPSSRLLNARMYAGVAKSSGSERTAVVSSITSTEGSALNCCTRAKRRPASTAPSNLSHEIPLGASTCASHHGALCTRHHAGPARHLCISREKMFWDSLMRRQRATCLEVRAAVSLCTDLRLDEIKIRTELCKNEDPVLRRLIVGAARFCLCTPSAAPRQLRCWHHAKLRHRHRYLLDSVLNQITHRRIRDPPLTHHQNAVEMGRDGHEQPGRTPCDPMPHCVSSSRSAPSLGACCTPSFSGSDSCCDAKIC